MVKIVKSTFNGKHMAGRNLDAKPWPHEGVSLQESRHQVVSFVDFVVCSLLLIQIHPFIHPFYCWYSCLISISSIIGYKAILWRNRFQGQFRYQFWCWVYPQNPMAHGSIIVLHFEDLFLFMENNPKKTWLNTKITPGYHK